MNEPFDKSKYQGKLSMFPIRLDCEGNQLSLPEKSEPNIEWITPKDGSIAGGGFINGIEYIEMMLEGKLVKFFRLPEEKGPPFTETP
jgi:hypothetical protein